MPKALTLETKFPIRSTKIVHGDEIPWEIRSYGEDFATARREGGAFDLSCWSLLEMSGPDARDYLQRMSTTDFRQLQDGEVRHGAFLTGRGTVVTLGFFARLSDKYRYVVASPQGPIAAEHIEKFHFAENFNLSDLSGEQALWGLYGHAIHAKLGIGNLEPLKVFEAKLGEISLWGFKDDVDPHLVFTFSPRAQGQAFAQALSEMGVSFLGLRVFERLRIEGAVPAVGSEISEKEIILETGFDRAVARNKGCYPGQEVVERIFTYGQVNRKLFPVSLEGRGKLPEPPFTSLDAGKVSATVVSVALDPADESHGVGLAYVQKKYWDQKEDFRSEEAGVSFRLRNSK